MKAEELRNKADSVREEDPSLAAELYAEASDLGDVPSSVSLGSMLLIGKEIEKDWEKARLYTQRAADAGDPTGICNLGVLCTDSDCVKALELFEKAAELGNISAVRNAAVLLRTGGGVPMDSVRAASWLEKGCEMGDASCMAILAHMLRTGEGIPEDKPRAAKLYRAAAEAGDRDSMYDLAMMLDSGDGVPTDRDDAEAWFRRAADLGDDDARLCIGGILYEKGMYQEAASYFTDAALDGDVKAMYNLALMNLGQELNDPSKGREWLETAAEAGFAYAQTMLGSMLLDEGDPKNAEAWLRKAADQNEPTAMYNLGAVALAGRIAMDDKKAVGYLMKAADAGVPEAGELLAMLSSNGMVRSQQLFQRGDLVGAVQSVGTHPVATVHDDAVDSERLGRARVVGAVAYVDGPLLGHVEERERQRQRIRIGLVALRLVPADDDLGDIVESVGPEVLVYLVPAGAGDDPYPLPAPLKLPEDGSDLGERDRRVLHGRKDALGESCHHLRLLVVPSSVQDVEVLVQILREPGRVVGLAFQCQYGSEHSLDPRLRVEERVVEIEQVQIVVLHSHPSRRSFRDPIAWSAGTPSMHSPLSLWTMATSIPQACAAR